MKKTYIAPAIAEMNIEAESIIAASPVTMNINSSTTVTSSQALDGGRRGEWGNLWSK